MSDDMLKVFPRDKNFVPTKAAAEKAAALLSEYYPDGENVDQDFYDDPEFIDAGEYTEGFACPVCGHYTAVNPWTKNDAGTAWYRENVLDVVGIERDYAAEVVLPHCGHRVALESVRFRPPAGFARFCLGLWNPDSADELSEAQMRELSQILGCELIQLRARY